jgi:hypothetical protein
MFHGWWWVWWGDPGYYVVTPTPVDVELGCDNFIHICYNRYSLFVTKNQSFYKEFNSRNP